MPRPPCTPPARPWPAFKNCSSSGAPWTRRPWGPRLDAARNALHDQKAYGSVIYLVRAAQRAAASMRERLSVDFWALLLTLEKELAEGAQTPLSEAEALQQIESALQLVAALSGLSQENMNRVAGWRFLDMGRRIERGSTPAA
uniref:Alpha-E domain-containing protein n=1 Tax=Phenylobacterium glaciei TaxID=2803784 RepID=A0A974SBL6_9CAUL|nr:alpha-E domain-containing protein [Phenylobacterium glaciei]